MILIDKLKAQQQGEQSYFRAALLKEDIARLEKLLALADACATPAEFEKDGLYIGWTQGDLRTAELKEALLPLMAAIFAYVKGKQDAAVEQDILDKWAAFNALRMKTLVHCL